MQIDWTTFPICVGGSYSLWFVFLFCVLFSCSLLHLTAAVFWSDQPGVCNLLFVLTLASKWLSWNQGFLTQIKEIKSEQSVRFLALKDTLCAEPPAAVWEDRVPPPASGSNIIGVTWIQWVGAGEHGCSMTAPLDTCWVHSPPISSVCWWHTPHQWYPHFFFGFWATFKMTRVKSLYPP